MVLCSVIFFDTVKDSHIGSYLARFDQLHYALVLFFYFYFFYVNTTQKQVVLEWKDHGIFIITIVYFQSVVPFPKEKSTLHGGKDWEVSAGMREIQMGCLELPSSPVVGAWQWWRGFSSFILKSCDHLRGFDKNMLRYGRLLFGRTLRKPAICTSGSTCQSYNFPFRQMHDELPGVAHIFYNLVWVAPCVFKFAHDECHEHVVAFLFIKDQFWVFFSLCEFYGDDGVGFTCFMYEIVRISTKFLFCHKFQFVTNYFLL